MRVAQSIACEHCGSRYVPRFDIAHGGAIVELGGCNCPGARHARGLCVDCDNPPRSHRALRCLEHSYAAERAAQKRYYATEKGRAAKDRANATRRAPGERARRRRYERERYALPEVRTRRLRNSKRRRMKNPAQKAEHARRYKEKYPERVAEQQRRANAKRAEAKRAHMHRYCTKYVGRGIAPTCVDCGAVVEWSGKGRPRKRCPGECNTQQQSAA